MHGQTGFSLESYLFVPATNTHPKEKWKLGKKKKVLKQIQGRVTLNIKVIKQNKEEKYQRLANEVSEQ